MTQLALYEVTTFVWNVVLSGLRMRHFCVPHNCQNKTERPTCKCSTCRWRAKHRSRSICIVRIADSRHTHCAVHRGEPVTPQMAEFACSGFYSVVLCASLTLAERIGQLQDLNGTHIVLMNSTTVDKSLVAFPVSLGRRIFGELCPTMYSVL